MSTTTGAPPIKVTADFTRFVLVTGTSKEHRAKAALPWDVVGYDSVTTGRFMRVDGKWTRHGDDSPHEPPVRGTLPGVMFHNPVRK